MNDNVNIDSLSSPSMSSPINHPPHYQASLNGKSLECIDAMEAVKGWFKTAIFCECNTFKYNWRVGFKDAVPQDLGKSAWYADKAQKLWNKALYYRHPGKNEKYAVIDSLIWTDGKKQKPAVLYTDGKQFYVCDKEYFDNNFHL